MDISVIGPGRWGSFIAWYLNTLNFSVSLYGRKSSKNMEEFIKTGKNELLTLPKSVRLTTDITSLASRTVIISVSTQSLRAVMEELKENGMTDRDFVICMKGIEIDSGKRLSEIVSEYLTGSGSVSVWIGPGHVEEFVKGVPNCMVIDGENREMVEKLVDMFRGPLIRFYYGSDLIGNELGAASKNVIGIAAGMLDGMGLSSVKGALMARGTREISLLIEKMGGNPVSAYGLCHLGDYEATVFSSHSHNRRFGECFVRGENYNKLAEGYYTAAALHNISKKTGIDLPICGGVYRILYEGADPKETLNSLFTRNLKNEF